MKILIKILILAPLCIKSQPLLNAEVFIGEINSTAKSEPVYLKDSIVFYLNPGDRFYSRCHLNPEGNILAHVTRKDGSNGMLDSKNIHRSTNQTFFKVNYSSDFFVFSNKPSIYGTSKYSNCTYYMVNYWQNYFLDSTDFKGLSFKAYNKDTSALYMLLTCNNLDVDGSGQWLNNNWKIINNYSDRELAVFLFNRLPKNYCYHSSLIIDGSQITPGLFGDENNLLLNYYETNYPLAYEIFKLEHFYKPKDYKREYKKLRKKLALT